MIQLNPKLTSIHVGTILHFSLYYLLQLCTLAQLFFTQHGCVGVFSALLLMSLCVPWLSHRLGCQFVFLVVHKLRWPLQEFLQILQLVDPRCQFGIACRVIPFSMNHHLILSSRLRTLSASLLNISMYSLTVSFSSYWISLRTLFDFGFTLEEVKWAKKCLVNWGQKDIEFDLRPRYQVIATLVQVNEKILHLVFSILVV